MISRYTRQEMAKIWTEENKLQKWLEVELAALEGLARYGYIPKDVPAKVRSRSLIRTRSASFITSNSKMPRRPL